MIDHIIGRPNPSWKRAQVITAHIICISRSVVPGPYYHYLLDMAHRSWEYCLSSSLAQEVEYDLKYERQSPSPFICSRLAERFTPYQIILSTLTAVYALRNLDTILGFTGTPLPPGIFH
jgi:hypothetical protein